MAEKLNNEFKLNKILDTRALLIFQRLQRFYKKFNIVSAVVGGLSLAALTFNEFHPCDTPLARAAEGLLCSSALTAVIAVMTSVMLSFRFEGYEHACRQDLIIAWTPLVFLDVAIVEYLLGLVLWYSGKNTEWRMTIMVTQITALLLFTVSLALWMWFSMSEKGSLGAEEIRAIKERKRIADN